MDERVKWIEHKGVKILFSDYGQLKGSDIERAIQEGERQSLSSGQKTVYAINDVTGSAMNDNSTAAAKHWENACKEKGIELKLALVGLTGIKRTLASMIKRNAYFASNLDDAKEWVVKQIA